MLQFRANDREEIKSEKCAVDCWILPRVNPDGVTLRYGLYRLLLQGFRRVQGMCSMGTALYGRAPYRREFYSGTPIWKMDDGSYTSTPWEHVRQLDSACGAFYWMDPDGKPLETDDQEMVWDTMPFWSLGGVEASPQEAEAQEAVYYGLDGPSGQ